MVLMSKKVSSCEGVTAVMWWSGYRDMTSMRCGNRVNVHGHLRASKPAVHSNLYKHWKQPIACSMPANQQVKEAHWQPLFKQTRLHQEYMC